MIPVALALAHFLWQGALIGALAAVLQRLTRRPTTRYAIGVAALGAMLVAVPTTAGFVWSRQPPVANAFVTQPIHFDQPSFPSPDAGTAEIPQARGVASPPAATGSAPIRDVIEGWLDRAAAALHRPRTARTIVALWLVGVLALTIRLTGAWFVTRRLATQRLAPIGDELQARVRRLADRLRLTGAVRCVESRLVTVPMVVGALRPIVLIPIASLTGLSVAQVDALIAHELAHLRRRDPIVNAIQSIVETLLFYHPAVWWISHRVREAREHCCDDLALEVIGDRVTYATALADLAARTTARPALAATGGPLLERIARVLGAPSPRPWGAASFAALVVVIGVAGLTPLVASWSALPSVDRPSALQPALIPGASVALVVPEPAIQESVERSDALGSIRGTVVDEVTGEALAGVRVSFCGEYAYFRDDPERLVANRAPIISAQDGGFFFDRVPAGRYHICTEGLGKYLPDYSLRFYEVRPGEAVTGVVKRKPAVGSSLIDGSVVDERGERVAGARVYLVTPAVQDGIPLLQRLRDSASTAEGRFEFNIWNGRWAVVASSVPRFVPTNSLAPGPSAASTGPEWNGFVEILNEPLARTRTLVSRLLVDTLSTVPRRQDDEPLDFFTLAPGQNRGDLQVQLRAVPAVRISGRIVGGDLPIAGVRLALERTDLPLTRPPAPAAEAVTDAAGRFAFLRVPPGLYRIRADTSPEAGPNMAIRASARCDATCAAGFPPTVWVDAPVEARSTVDALTIEAHRGVSIRGSLRFDGPDAPGDDVRNLMFSLVRADGRGGMVPTVGVSAGEFASVELAAGEYLIRPGPFGTPAGWTIESAMVDGRDITDEPLVIGDGSPPPGRVTVTVGPSNPANLSGTVRTPAGQPDAAATVLVFPADRKYWSHNLAGTSMGRTRIAMSSRLGAYLLRDVRPGDYLVAAVPDTAESFSALFSPDPALFERLAPHATHVTVEEGVDTVQDVRTVR